MVIENWPKDVVLVHLPHELQKHGDLRAIIDAAGKREDCDVVVDFSNVEIVGSPTFSILLELRAELQQSGHKLILCNVAPAIRGVFTVSQLDGVFDFAEDESAALATLHAGE